MTEARDYSAEPQPLFTEEDWQTFGWVEDVRPALKAALDAGRDVALATLFQQDGSAPRGPGAQMLFDGADATGFFSGGCVEGDVAAHAAQVIADGEPRVLHYGVGSPWLDIKLRCGGAIHIFVERVDAHSKAARELIEASVRLRDEKHAGVIVFAGAGMARYVGAVEKATGLPVVDPTQVAVSLALAAVMQGR